MSLPRIAARVFNTPLLYDAAKAAAFLQAFGPRITGDELSIEGAEPVDHVAFQNGRPSLGKLGDNLGRFYESRGRPVLDIVDGIAIIPIEGTLVHKGAFVGQSSGETSYQGLQTQVARAISNPAVRGVVFEVDSFGGEASGAFETADMVAKLSEVKPTVAILTDFAMSGGYLLAAAARSIVMPQFGQAGSIGVVRMHVDFSRKLENDGIKVTLITAGKHKADGNSFQPLPESVGAKLQAEAEAMRGVFAEHVGKYRGKRMSAAQAIETEANVFRADDALRLGLVDAIAPANEAFAAFVDDIKRKG